jgi:hypothetical protein
VAARRHGAERRRSGAPAETLNLLLPTLGAGALVLFPSLFWLLRVFKRSAAVTSR